MPKATLTLLLDFDDQVQKDQGQTAAFLHRRDRKFALACEADGRHPGPANWLAYLGGFNRERQIGGSDPRLRVWRRVNLAFIAVGTLLGLVTMLGLLFYDGSGQINVTVILGFVLLQVSLAALTSLQSFFGWRPWGQLPDMIARRLGRARPSGTVLRQLQPQLSARAAHAGGLAFGISGLLTLLGLVVVQDLAFGWSTTLSTAPEAFHRLVQTLAWPWQSLWPAAVPSLELVAESRFYRIEDAGGSTAPARWGDWWPFVAMVWLCYIILLRFILLMVAISHLELRARRLLARHPGLKTLLYRMETPALETGNAHSDAADQPQMTTSIHTHPLPNASVAIRWAGAGDNQLASSLLKSEQHLVLAAGGAATLTDDHETLQQARLTLGSGEPRAALILTHAWEPPTGELADFLAEALQQWPQTTHIALVPVGAAPDTPPEHQVAQWLRFTERLGHTRLSVSLASGEPS
ncbi:DUF2868 domain-containing protein [Marinobacter changyiensis]|uniref:DUF2868 domain-containing protein n=1 Tax=Marinobacter changyiensis TaxID=2604091 RepID=UPI0015D30E29|nr:DUF2868 domain-containing protein [Marinobacter changyiensis]